MLFGDRLSELRKKKKNVAGRPCKKKSGFTLLLLEGMKEAK
jgi:hypothetical protein